MRRRVELEASQWWSRERLEGYRIDRLRRFLAGVGRDVPYYRARFAELGFDPGGVERVADLAALPLLDKDTIRAETAALAAEDAGSLTRMNTGGSSGEPLIFYVGRERKTHDVAAKWRATRWWDVDIGDREIVIWGSPVELGAQDWVREVRDRILRSRLVSAFDMSAENLDRFVREIVRFRPAMIFGYPSCVALIARHARRMGVPLDGLGVKAVFVTSEKLYPHQLEEITGTVGCPVANGYGGRDAGFIAHECPAGGMHLSAEDIIVEIVDRDGAPLPAGEEGEIVVTHMATPEFPFVRYRTGDVGVLTDRPCPCGRGLPLLDDVRGRTTDFIVTADGTIMHGLALIYVLRDQPGIEKFKIIQPAAERITVEIVPGEGYTDGVESAILSGLRQRLGERTRVEIRRVADIAAERSGKFRHVVSHVPVH